MLFFGLDSLSSIKEGSRTISPKEVTCSLCYAIAYDGMYCNNRKCQSIFCGDCFQKQKLKFLDVAKKEFKCPFCQTFSGYSKIGKEIQEYIQGFKYFCNKNKNCKEEYTFEQLVIGHKHNYMNIVMNKTFNDEICYVCKKIIKQTNLNTLTCALCNNIGCYKNISYTAIQEDNKNNNNIIAKNENNENNNTCIQKCFICNLPICKYCSKQNHNKNKNMLNFICDECNQSNKCNLCNNNNSENICIVCKNYLCKSCSNKCEFCGYIFCSKNDCLSKKISCQNCITLKSQMNNKSCKHEEILNCSNCFEKCKICKKNMYDIICQCCYSKICVKNCSIKCKFCKLLCCNKCTLICSICKKITCSNCANTCDECDKYKSFVSCINCKSNIIKKCQYNTDGGKICYKKLSIGCWNVCNYCSIILCSDHCYTCSNCEDIICDIHYTKCNKCLNKDESEYIKLCLKKCILNCSFCDNTTTVLCKEKNHPKNFVHNFGCQHNICNSCIKKCSDCGKIVRKCLECIDYFYELCRYCKKYQCLNCCSKCKQCDDVFCSLNHKCGFCDKIFPGKCFNCDISKRNKCMVCKERFKICELCKTKFICDFACYWKYKNNLNKNNSNEHLCQMFVCKKHFNDFTFS